MSATSASARSGRTVAGADRSLAAPTPALGTREVAGPPAPPISALPPARRQHPRSGAPVPGLGPAAPPPPPRSGGSGPAGRSGLATQRGVDGGFQGLVLHPRRPALRSADVARVGQPLWSAGPSPGRSEVPPRPSGLCGAVSPSRTAGCPAQGQWESLRLDRPGRPPPRRPGKRRGPRAGCATTTSNARTKRCTSRRRGAAMVAAPIEASSHPVIPRPGCADACAAAAKSNGKEGGALWGKPSPAIPSRCNACAGAFGGGLLPCVGG